MACLRTERLQARKLRFGYWRSTFKAEGSGFRHFKAWARNSPLALTPGSKELKTINSGSKPQTNHQKQQSTFQNKPMNKMKLHDNGESR